MDNESETGEDRRWKLEVLGTAAVAAMKRRNLSAQFVPDRAEALRKVIELIPDGSTVAWGHSVTLHQVGAVAELKANDRYVVVDPFQLEASELVIDQRRLEAMRRGTSADVFLSSVNAITEDGRLIMRDSLGNRVAPTVFGPKKVIIVAGANKITRTLDGALERVKEVAVTNARRHVVKHHIERFASLPCVKSGKCVDCYDPQRICRFTVIIEGESDPGVRPAYTPRMHVVVVGEELGL